MRIFAVYLACSFAMIPYAEAQSDFQVITLENTLLFTDNESTISLYGLQLPDVNTNSELARKSRQRLRNFVLKRPVHLETSHFLDADARFNRFGDIHGQLFSLSGVWIQKEMIETGLAFWSGAAGYPKHLREVLVNAENEAEETLVGIWQTYEILKANKFNEKGVYADFVIAEGRIRNVHNSAKMTYLNFGEDWKTDFTAAISSKNKRKFEKQGWKLESLMHKLVRIRGPLRSYNGPFMELSFPEQLEIREVSSE